MKKSFICMFPFLLLVTFLWGQSTVAKQEGVATGQSKSRQETVVGDEAANSEDGSGSVDVDAEQEYQLQQELQAYMQEWKNLARLPLDQYLESFRLFMEQAQLHYELQPYVLAECLWFQVGVLPRFQQVQQDGSLDKIMELNMTTLPQVQQQVAGFLAQMEEGVVAIHPWSDGVVTFFQELIQNPFMGLNGALQKFGSLPELAFLQDDHFFMPVEDSYRTALLYHGLTDFQQLVSRFAEAMAMEEESIPEAVVEESGEAALPKPEDRQLAPDQEGILLPPSTGGIDWHQVVSSQPLMYLLRHLPSGRQVYSYLLDYHSGETPASRCENLYLATCRLQEQWGFSLKAALPDFSAAAVEAAADELFILYCLPAHDLERLSADLACVGTMASAYFPRTISLLHRSTDRNRSDEEKEGSL